MATFMDARSRMSVLGAVVMSSMAKQASADLDETQEAALRMLYDATGGASWTNKVRVLNLSHSAIKRQAHQHCHLQLKIARTRPPFQPPPPPPPRTTTTPPPTTTTTTTWIPPPPSSSSSLSPGSLSPPPPPHRLQNGWGGSTDSSSDPCDDAWYGVTCGTGNTKDLQVSLALAVDRRLPTADSYTVAAPSSPGRW